MNKDQIKKSSIIFLKGLLMGSADVIPGVSGGTIAFITGIYYRLIHAISMIKLSILKKFFKGEFKEVFEEIKSYDWGLLIPLGLGVGIAIILFSGIIGYLMKNYVVSTFSFFAGLILASAIVIFKLSKKDDFTFNIERIGLIIGGFVFAYLLSGLTATQSIGHSLPIIFVTAMIAICAMILPGISGSFLLLLMGQYEYIINKLHQLDVLVIIVFCLGAGIGIISFSKLLNKLLSSYRNLTMAFLIGLMLGSLRTPYLKIIGLEFSWLQIVVPAIIGFLLVLFIERKS